MGVAIAKILLGISLVTGMVATVVVLEDNTTSMETCLEWRTSETPPVSPR